MKADMLSPLTVLDSSYEGSLSSPMKKRKKVQWRNESDYMNQLTKGNKLSKDASALKAHEASFNLNYGERDGKNVINTAEYQRNLIHIALFKWNLYQINLQKLSQNFISPDEFDVNF